MELNDIKEEINNKQKYIEDINNKLEETNKNVYRRVTNVEHNFLLIDNDPKDENLKIRQNFNELIKI